MIGNVFTFFSRRQQNEAVGRKPLTEGLRRRTLMLLRDANGRSLYETLEYLRGKVAYLVGRVPLTHSKVDSIIEDAMGFLRTCSDAHFLDAVNTLSTKTHTVAWVAIKRGPWIDSTFLHDQTDK